MKNKRVRLSKAIHIAAAVALMGALWVAVPPAHAGTTIPVNTTTNALGDGHCSLQEAVAAANTDTSQDSGACAGGSGADTITFHIGDDGSSQIITLSESLDITTPVTLDGTTQQAVYGGVPLIHITGNFDRLIWVIDSATGTTIKGLQFSNTYAGSEYVYDDLYLGVNGVTVTGNYFNTDGTNQLGGSVGGIFINSSNNTIGTGTAANRNLFGGKVGVYMWSGSLNFILGNWFGVRASDGNALLTGLASSQPAIWIEPAAATCANNLIRGNVVAGFNAGVVLDYPTNHNTIGGNYIGVGANGTTALGNGYGILIHGSSDNTIGGTTALDRNVISGSTYDFNVYLTTDGSHSSDRNIIQGNYIGTTADGLTGLSPLATGIRIDAGSNTTIGGTAAGAGNVISGNNYGVVVMSGNSGTIIQGNKIGTDPSGTIAVGNNYGVHADTAVNIGDSLTPGNNIIGGNPSGVGILLDGSSGSMVYGNRIGVSAAAKSLPTATGVGLWNASATLGGNWIAFNAEGIYLAGTSTVSAAATMNCFNGSSGYAVRNDNTGHEAPFTNNWWGSDTGPRHLSNSGGTGDVVSDHVTYAPYLTLPAAACHIFADVPVAGKEWMEPWVDSFYMHGITTGCGANPLTYCPENPVTRAAMAVFILRAIEGPTYVPPAAHHYFSDLPVTGKEWMEPWVDEFYDRGITTGCGMDPLRYCPENPVTRAAMAVFLLRAMEGAAYAPPAAHHYFTDLPVTGKEWMEPWVDEFYDRAITTGCGAAPLTYCPENPVTRAAMAVFISRAYGLYP